MNKEVVDKIIEFLGGYRKAEKKLGICGQNFSKWKRSQVKIPIEQCVKIEYISNGLFSLKDLRPDLYIEIF